MLYQRSRIKQKFVKVPYSLPMKFVTLNFRGVNGDSGILKRQRLVRVMSEQKYGRSSFV